MYGCGAWQLGVLAVGKLLLEIAAGSHGDTLAEGAQMPTVIKAHVMRAHGLLTSAAAVPSEASKRDDGLLHVPVALPTPGRVHLWQPTQGTQPPHAAPPGFAEDGVGEGRDGHQEQAPLPAAALHPESEVVPPMHVGYGDGGVSVQLGNALGLTGYGSADHASHFAARAPHSQGRRAGRPHPHHAEAGRQENPREVIIAGSQLQRA